MRSWWSRRWAQVFEASAAASRLSRGREYARAGAVIGMTIGRGAVQASVQGSRKRPYSVSVRIDPLSGSEWTEVARALASESGLLAQVLSGKLPERLEEVLASSGVSLFPQSFGLWAPAHCSCSCPDEANPCKHICAAFYTLLDRLEADPMLTFVLRGKDVDEVLEEARRYRAASPEVALPSNDVPSLPSAVGGELPAEYVEFWSSSGDFPSSERSEFDIGTRGFTLPLLPFADKHSLGRKAIEQVYELASRVAKQYLDRLSGHGQEGGPEGRPPLR